MKQGKIKLQTPNLSLKKCCIIPINRHSLVSLLKEIRYPSSEQQKSKKSRQLINDQPGKSFKLDSEKCKR